MMKTLAEFEKQREKICHKMRKEKLDIHVAIDKFYPDAIKYVSHVLITHPPTQVSVERLFSSLKILKSDRRNRLKHDTIDDILFLKTNWEK